jgi:ribosome-binding factor A
MANVPNQRVARVAGEVRAVLGEVLARDEIKDPRVRGAGLITVTHVRVSGDLRHARALFTVHGLDAAQLERVREGLDHASGYFRQAIARRLRTKVSPAVTFQVDEIFEKATRLDALLHDLRPVAADAAANDAAHADAGPADADETE